MIKVRPQYHLRPTNEGTWAWDVRRLIELSKDLPVKMVNADEFPELDKDHWYFQGNVNPTCRNIIGHIRLIEASDISHPIILDESGRVMDGMHRICKAVLDGVDQLPAVQFRNDPQPDFMNCDPDDLPYFDIEEVIESLTRWAEKHSSVCGLAIIGSYARGTASHESDLDVVVLCDDADELLGDQSWLQGFGQPESVVVEKYGIVTSIFADYDWGLEIEFGITPRHWTDIPVDEGTARVISDGMNIHYDPENLLSTAAKSVMIS